ncbi:putative nucleotide-utilizing enzyme related tomolybdopterin-biosynthesis enzyme MoeA [Halalkaliarchaeum sp. AArc-CO]|uniref:competence/damage-inducible protein A n=1 Tax=Halalkaliarchaeum sp. AArc-CO TaxID=2866381 RepID=UPI00217D0CBF|nr:molybdopterin-binding protein [Halalkaliarchaeum sp. AArc-CO]UWG51119.1 putative nucleotide-utilizing enzyme related tomolybdopterin-biosynthesis enzyme MoeA [Halalkaliarchaeum sp. AArc-CO]
MDVAIVTVGDELLAGDTQDTNSTWLCGQLTARGVRVRRVTTVPDDVGEIARVVNEYRAEYDAVISTGGLGPTHDDVTMEAVAAAFGRTVEPHEGALAWLEDHGGYSAEDLVAGTTNLPAGARMLPNEEGVAPGAVVETVYVLPGVPAEMKAMFQLVADEFSGDRTYTTVLTTPQPESELIDLMVTLQETFGVSVGSYPGENVRVKVTARDPETLEDAASWLRNRIEIVDSPEVSETT